MKLVALKLTNFRGYQNETCINFGNLTAFVGKNDVGKSTILEALDIFFNDGKGVVKIDKGDVNVVEERNGNQEIVISICFADLPKSIIIDSTNETTLKDEYMLNRDDQLEIVKKYKNGGSAKVFIHAYHPTNTNCANLLLKKNNDLKEIVKNENIECEDKTKNAELRKAIWKKFRDNLELDDVEIDVSKEDAKKIWEKLQTYLPIYSLFQSDRKNSDNDEEVQDPLKEAVRQILSEESLQETLSKVADEVEEKLREVSNRTLDKLKEFDSTIAESLNPVIPDSTKLKWQDVFKNVSITGDSDIPINKRGSGVKRLILLSFFRAEADKRANGFNGRGIIYAVEEPETSQHAGNQRVLIEAFKSLANADNTQVILTTHSSFIVKQLELSELRLIRDKSDCEKEIMNVLPGQLQYPSLNEVNYVAFNEVTEEYHDELYSFIEYKWKDDFKKGQPTRLYKKIQKDGTIKEQNIILPEYIRHQIHHPENKENVKYTKEELKQSIDAMRDFIQQKCKNGYYEFDSEKI